MNIIGEFYILTRPGQISPWTKPIWSGYFDVIGNRLWRHQQNVNRASERRGRCVKIMDLSSFMDSLCRVRNKIMYVLSWRTVYALTSYRVLFWCLFPSLLRNSGNKHQNINRTLSSMWYYSQQMHSHWDCFRDYINHFSKKHWDNNLLCYILLHSLWPPG